MDVRKASLLNAQMQAATAKQDGVLKTSQVDTGDVAKLRELAQDFEAIFIETMLTSMRKSVEKSELMNGGNAEDIFRGMLDSEYAKLMSRTGSYGISDAIAKDLMKAVENQAGNREKSAGLAAYRSENLQDEQNKARIEMDKSHTPQAVDIDKR